MSVDTDVGAVAAAVLECARAALAATTAGQPARVCVTAGELAWDECDCGLLSVAVGPLYLSSGLPLHTAGSGPPEDCAPPLLAADVTVTVLRCSPGPDVVGNPPSCTALDASALTWLVDLDAVRTAVRCCLVDLLAADTIAGYLMRDSVPLGPQGGCVGWETRASVAWLNCLCPVG